MFNTRKLNSGRSEVEEIYDIADTLGVGVIRINGKKPAMSTGSVNGFEVGRVGYNHYGAMSGAILDKGYVYLYPDKNGTRWGFVLDTEYNRKILASHIAAPVLTVADKNTLQEIIDYCDENGINTVPEKAGNPYAKKSINEENLENKNNKLEADLRMMMRQVEAMQKEKEETERAMLRKEQYRESKEDHVVKEVRIDPTTDEGVEVDVPATTKALNQEPVKTKPESKAGKALAGKKLAKK